MDKVNMSWLINENADHKRAWKECVKKCAPQQFDPYLPSIRMVIPSDPSSDVLSMDMPHTYKTVDMTPVMLLGELARLQNKMNYVERDKNNAVKMVLDKLNLYIQQARANGQPSQARFLERAFEPIFNDLTELLEEREDVR